jgi:FAD-linked sulfhydryl oxidase
MATPATPIRMPPQIWGPIFWSTLHIASLSYSDQPTERQRKNVKAFYESMVDVLPCPVCRHHYETNLKEMPLDEALNSRMELVQWVWKMHNKINVQLGKREFGFEEFIESMQNLEKKSPVATENALASTKSLSSLEKVLLGAGATLLVGTGLYYLYQEGIRRIPK